MAIAIGPVLGWSVALATIPALLIFRPYAWGGGFFHNVRRMFGDYWHHVLLLVFIIVEKNFVDDLNDPIRGVFGDFTWILHAIEGDSVLYLQTALAHPWLTAVLNFHYLWMYVFLNYFAIVFYAYMDDRELASMASLNYSLIYILAVPFYIFFNVQITSAFIPGMDSLLYHWAPNTLDFFVAADPLDNAFPSLHIAIPFGLILVTWWTMKRRGYNLRNWEYRRFFWFLLVNFVIFAFSILYLGIHWITDIPGGLLVGLLGALIADEFHKDVFGTMRRAELRVRHWAAPYIAGARRRLPTLRR